MGFCVDCRYWRGPGHGNRRECERPGDEIVVACEEGHAGVLLTPPDYGCVHFEPRKAVAKKGRR